MKFKLFITYLLFSIFLNIQQKNNILLGNSVLEINKDSSLINSNKDNVNKIVKHDLLTQNKTLDYYNQQANNYYNKGCTRVHQDPYLANRDFLISFDYAKKSKNDTITLFSAKYIGITYTLIKETDSSIIYLNKSLDYAHKIRMHEEIVDLNNLLVKNFTRGEKFKKIHSLFIENDSLFKFHSNDIESVNFIIYKVNQSRFFFKTGNYDLALAIYRRSKTFF